MRHRASPPEGAGLLAATQRVITIEDRTELAAGSRMTPTCGFTACS
jgi:hypothetical protein